MVCIGDDDLSAEVDTVLRRLVRRGLTLLPLVLLPGTLWAAAGDFPPLDSARISDIDTERRSSIDIPQARERPNVPTAGPFFDVTDVRILGIEDDPERGIDLVALRQRAMAAVARQAAEQEIEEQGFSNAELREIARLLERVRGRQDESIVTKVALFDELVDLIDELDSRRGVSVFDLEAVAREIQDEIRATGMLLAQVVIPPQTVRDGVVDLRVYPGILGDVAVLNNDIYRARPLQSAFSDRTGATVRVEEIEERLRLVNDLGGMDISGVFVPGRNPGETQLQLNVLNERRWSALTRVDNHGADVTGRTRGLLGLTLYDPTGSSDQLALNFLRSEGPNEVTLANVRYQRPFPGLRNYMEFGVSRNEFTIGGEFDISGDTLNYEALFGRRWMRTREANLSQTFFLAYKDSQLDLGIEDRDQGIVELGTALSYDQLVPEWRMVIDSVSGLRVGQIRSGRIEGQLRPGGTDRFPGQDEYFYILSQQARVFKLFDVPWPFTDARSRHSFLFRLNAQYTDQFLPGVNRFSLGGADSVRAILSDDISVDKGAFASMQVYWDLPSALDFEMPWANQRFSEFLRPFVFYDYGYGVTNAQRVNLATQEDTWFEFRAYGVGLEYNLFKNPRGNFLVRGSVNVAWPENFRFGDDIFEQIIEERRRVYADITFEFDLSTFQPRDRR